MGKKDKERKKTFSCGAVVYRHGLVRRDDIELLLVKQFAHKDNWGIPKGHMNPGETVQECASRETREEAGVDIVLGSRLPDVFAVYKKEDKTVVSFLARQTCSREPNSGDPDSEVADARWFKINELPKIHPYQQSLVRHAIDLIRQELDLNVV